MRGLVAMPEVVTARAWLAYTLIATLAGCQPVAGEAGRRPPRTAQPGSAGAAGAAGGSGGGSAGSSGMGMSGTIAGGRGGSAVDAAPPTGSGGAIAVDAAPPADLRPDQMSAPLTGGIESASVSGFQLLVRRRRPDGTVGAPEPFDIKGISWSPHEKGANRPTPHDHLRAADRDLPLMKAANINVVKTYHALPRAVMDKLQAQGMMAIVGVLSTANAEFESVVTELRDHPALLMWLVGNEWNLNRFYGTCEMEACYARVAEVVRRIKSLDPKHPVGTSFAPAGEIPTEQDWRRLEAVDVWGLNIYSRPGFFNRFTSWRLQAQRSGFNRPFFLSEYGADAYDNRTGRANEAAQAEALRLQTREIRGQLSARNAAFPCLGGTPFEWNDEWWKRGNNGGQEPGGFVHGGVADDGFANEEWWGVVDIDRRPRAAYQVLKELYAQ